MTDQEIEQVIHSLHQDIKVGPMELVVGRAIAEAERRKLAESMLGSVQAEDAIRKAAVLAERERCARIAEIPNMSRADIARAIRGQSNG